MSALYVHIPFCRHICYYCDFAKLFYNEKMCDQYLDRLEKDLAVLSDDFDTVYIGGGTPSGIDYRQLERLLLLLDSHITKVKEYTIECNPEALDEDKLMLLKQHGINRLSIGVQTFQDDLLKGIGRVHTGIQAINIIQKAKNLGFDNISIDMMYGLPDQTKDAVKEDLAIIAELPIKHISYYSLIHEEKTIFAHKGIEEMDEDLEEELYELIDTALEKQGFHQYEISNYAKDGYASKHNLKYWYYEDYIGIGVGAAGKVNHQMLENSRAFSKYIQGENITNVIDLNKEDEMFEDVMMHLRILEGIDERIFEERYHISFREKYHDAIDKNIENHNLMYEDHHYHCTKQSLRYLNSILLDFMK